MSSIEVPTPATSTVGIRSREARARLVMVALVVALVLLGALSLGAGATGVSPLLALSDLLAGRGFGDRERLVLVEIRLPRLVMGVAVGASLAVAGAIMQGLFRNPLADPGLVGVGAGASLGAITAIVLGGATPALAWIGEANLVPIAAFFGAWGATLLLYRLSTRGGRTSVVTMLLGGIAMAAIAGALAGLLIFVADDTQLRNLTFWSMGSLSGATWGRLAAALPVMAAAMLAMPILARGLNGLALGEAVAGHMGLPVQRIKRLSVLAAAAATGAAVAVSGGIGFVGIVVPHLLRISTGPDHRWLLPNAALGGAVMLVAADIIARTFVAPAELPIGIVTAILGGPVFLWILIGRAAEMEP